MTDGVLTGKALLLAQENLLIAALRRPRMSSIMKRTGLNEGHFPGHLRAAFNSAVTKSQDENSAAGHARGSSHLAALWEADPRMEGVQARAAAPMRRQRSGSSCRRRSERSATSSVRLGRSPRNGSRASWLRSRVVLGLNGAGAERRSRSSRTRSRDCSDRTTSPPLTSAPCTQGGRATSAISSSTCSEAYLGPRHPPRSSQPRSCNCGLGPGLAHPRRSVRLRGWEMKCTLEPQRTPARMRG